MRLHGRKVLLLIVLLVLSALSGLSWVVNPAHATSIAFVQKTDNPNAAGNRPFTIGPMTPSLGDALVVTVEYFGIGDESVSDSQGNVWTRMIQSLTASSSGPNTQIWTAIATAATSDTVTVSTTTNKLGMGAFLEYSGVASFGQTATQQLDSAGSSGTSSLTFTGVATTSWIVESFFYDTGGTSGSVSASNGQNLRDAMLTASCNTNGLGICNTYDKPAPSSDFALSLTYSSNNCNVPGCLASHSGVELLSGTPGGASIQTVTQCFGNCGAPAITLANTNSTHTVNFNTTLTLFYVVQMSATGFMLNVTTNLAKNYANSFSSPWLGFYTATCNPGVTPGTSACPFILQLGTNTAAVTKGRVSIPGGAQYAVAAGEWVGIAVSAQISGLDLNDTNTNVQMFQASGIIPGAIIADSFFGTGPVKVGLWAWIQTTTITSLPPPPGGIGAPCFGLDCILTHAVNGFCQIITTPCQTASSMFWVVVLTIVTFLALVYTLGNILPEANIGRMGLGEIGVLIFVMWIAIFTSFSLMSLYVLVLVFAITAILMGKRVSGYI